MKYPVFIAGSLILGSTPASAGNTEELWWINSARKDCVGAAPMTCFEIQRHDRIDPSGWQLFYDPIEGFDYEPGHLYRIRVSIRDREPPLPADVGANTYHLIEVMSKDSDPALRLTNLWKVESVGAIMAPRNRRQQPLVFEFNASQRTYSGDLGCNSVRGAITENDGETLALGPGMATRMACPDMTLEKAVGAALRDTRRYAIVAGRLRFYDENGHELMTFSPGD